MDHNNAFLGELRKSTDAEHTALEAMPASVAVTSPDLTIDGYVLYLKQMHRVHTLIETLTFPLLSELFPDLQSRTKTTNLESDLKLLGEEVSADTAVPVEGFKPTVAFALGILYVAEGSTLGGRVILKNVMKTVGDKVNGATRFFEGYGELTGPKWKEFLATMLAFQEQASEKESSEILEGGKFGFALTAAVFRQQQLARA